MRKIKLGLGVLTILLVLTGCGNLGQSDLSDNGSSTTTTSSYQSTGQVSNSIYDAVIENGKYKTSQSRGLNLSQNTNTYNLKSFESGLLNLSQTQFSTDKYLFQEGQTLKYTKVSNWLSRVSTDNPDGLNPKDNGSTDATKRNPIYLQQLLEQDFMVQSGSKMELSGMSIGLGLNKIDYYQKEQYGATYETEISTDKMIQQGKEMANTVLSRLRKMDGVGKKTILIALYQQAPEDSLVGGNFIAYGISKDGGTSISEWKTIKENNYVFPVVGTAASEASNDASDFDNFKSQVQSFFPNLSGVTAQAHYSNGTIAGMNIAVTTQFYGETEIMSFTQYIASMADKYLVKGIPIEITISSVDGIQAFVSRNATDKGFYTHVFGSY